MNQQQLLERAKQGDTQAIAALLNLALQPRGIHARVTSTGETLHLLLESPQLPDQATLVPAVRRAIANVGEDKIQQLIIYGRQTGVREPGWTQVLPLSEPSSATSAVPASTPVAPPPQIETVPVTAITPDPEPVVAQPVVEPVLSGRVSDYLHNSQAAAQADDNLRGMRNLLLGALVLLVAGIVGLHTSLTSAQRQALDKAQTLAAGADTASNSSDLQNLQAAQKQLQDAIRILEGIPAIPGSSNQAIEQQLTQIKAQLADVQERVRKEEMALKNLQSAQSLVQEATQTLQGSSPSLEARKTAESKVQEALTLLSVIPAGTSVSAQAQKMLSNYSQKYGMIQQQVQAGQVQQQQERPLQLPGPSDVMK